MTFRIAPRLFTFFLTLLFIPLSITTHADTLNIAVAANFKQALTTLKPLFEKNNPHHINIISAGTGQLSNQILNGAPFDIFLAANEYHPKLLFKQLHKKRQLKDSALFNYAKGKLVFYSHSAPPHKQNLSDLLKNKYFNKLALANHKLAPYGLAAQQTLEKMQHTYKKSDLITGQNVAQVYQFIHTGNVPAGFVAMSLMQNTPASHYMLVPSHYYQPIKQMALGLNNKVATLEFTTFLKSQQAHVIIRTMGYDSPSLLMEITP